MFKLFLILSLVYLSGCEKIIYRDNFDTYTNGVIGALPPGAPSGDSNQTVPGPQPDPNWVNVKVSNNYGSVIQPITDQTVSFWPYIQNGSNTVFRMNTEVVNASKNKKTFYWLGKKIDNNSAFICRFIGRYPLPNSTQLGTSLAFELLFDGLNIILRDITHIPNVIGTLAPRANGQDAKLHSVYITYRTDTGIATATVKQEGGGGQGSEQIPALERNEVASAERWKVECYQSTQGQPTAPNYLMDGVIMREK